MTTSESKGRFFNETNRFESIRIENWNALVRGIRVVSTQGTVEERETSHYRTAIPHFLSAESAAVRVAEPNCCRSD